MKTKNCSWRQVGAFSGIFTLLGTTLVLVTFATCVSEASIFTFWRSRQGCDGPTRGCSEGCAGEPVMTGEPGGTWYWLRSPDEEKRVVASLYNRYCIRCHG